LLNSTQQTVFTLAGNSIIYRHNFPWFPIMKICYVSIILATQIHFHLCF